MHFAQKHLIRNLFSGEPERCTQEPVRCIQEPEGCIQEPHQFTKYSRKGRKHRKLCKGRGQAYKTMSGKQIDAKERKDLDSCRAKCDERFTKEECLKFLKIIGNWKTTTLGDHTFLGSFHLKRNLLHGKELMTHRNKNPEPFHSNIS